MVFTNKRLADTAANCVNISDEQTESITYEMSTLRDWIKIKELLAAGHEIKWSANERFCVINGETFNISKFLYEKKLGLEKAGLL